MQTSDLIESLATDLDPVPRRAALSRLSVGLLIGGVITFALVLVTLGARSDLAEAVQTVEFWRKWAYVLASAAAALWVCLRLARPGGTAGVPFLVLSVPFLLLGFAAFLELRDAAPDERVELWLGRSALTCPWLIAAFAIPVFVGVLWAFRRFAPTRPRLAGFGAGCLAGAVTAILYAIHCDESAASFVASWYTAGMLVPAVIGGLVGPKVLRW